MATVNDPKSTPASMNEANERDPYNNNSYGTLVDRPCVDVNLPILDVKDFNERIIHSYEDGTAEKQLPADLSLARSLVPAGTAAFRDFSYVAPEIPEYIPGKIDFGRARNQSIDLCTPDSDWLLIIDGDEEITDPGDLILKLRHADTVGANSLSLKLQTQGLSNGKPMTGASGDHVRVFRRNMVRYRHPAHNQPENHAPTFPTTAILKSDYTDGMVERCRRTVPILLAMWKEAKDWPEDHPDRKGQLIHAAFFMSRMQGANRKPHGVIKWAERAIELGMENAPTKAPLWRWYAGALMELGRLDRAEERLMKAWELFPGYPDLAHLMMSVWALRWWKGVHDPALAQQYRFTMSTTGHLLDNLPEASKLLGLSLNVTREGAK
jgi:hypothetical protein